MKTFNEGLIVRQLMHWDIQHCQNDSGVITWVHVDVSSWEAELLQGLF
jgi:hypothetical protein